MGGMSKIRERALEIFLQAKEMPGYTLSWESHSKNVARIAEEVAKAMAFSSVKKIDLGIGSKDGYNNVTSESSVDVVFAAGLLHDVGRCVKKDSGLKHPILGYELLKKEGLEIPARIAMTHTYYGYFEIDRSEFWSELGERDTLKTKQFLENLVFDDIDLLVQLADNMGHALGVMTISDRFCDILTRHNIRSASDHLKELYRIKQYFDKKTGINIYNLFRDEILKTTMMEPNGSIGREQKITDETEDNL